MLPQPLNGLWQHPHWAASRPHWHRSDEDSRAISINPGDERRLTVSRGHLAPQVRRHSGPDGTDSQADSAGSIPVARTDDESGMKPRSFSPLISGRSHWHTQGETRSTASWRRAVTQRSPHMTELMRRNRRLRLPR